MSPLYTCIIYRKILIKSSIYKNIIYLSIYRQWPNSPYLRGLAHSWQTPSHIHTHTSTHFLIIINYTITQHCRFCITSHMTLLHNTVIILWNISLKLCYQYYESNTNTHTVCGGVWKLVASLRALWHEHPVLGVN